MAARLDRQFQRLLLRDRMRLAVDDQRRPGAVDRPPIQDEHSLGPPVARNRLPLARFGGDGFAQLVSRPLGDDMMLARRAGIFPSPRGGTGIAVPSTLADTSDRSTPGQSKTSVAAAGFICE